MSTPPLQPLSLHNIPAANAHASPSSYHPKDTHVSHEEDVAWEGIKTEHVAQAITSMTIMKVDTTNWLHKNITNRGQNNTPNPVKQYTNC